MKKVYWGAFASAVVSFSSIAGYADTPVKFGAYIDTYYAYDTNRPATFDRTVINPSMTPPALYATQPARHNEFNINLAYIEATLEQERVRGRLALQAGNSVQANYSVEPTTGTVSGGELSRHIQEAVVGYRIANGLWLDAGIYFSHIGLESFISKDNWTYTRSLAADNSPYYQTGVKLSYQFNSEFSGQLHVINGWQNISENNPQKALGMQISYRPSSAWTLTYNNFFGYEAGSRIFNDLIIKHVFNDRFQMAAQLDLGLQKPVSAAGYNAWYVLTFLARYQLTSKVAMTGRVERFLDSKSSIVASPAPSGFNVYGASFGVDVEPQAALLWRSEVRTLAAAGRVFQKYDGLSSDDTFVVTSLSLSI